MLCYDLSFGCFRLVLWLRVKSLKSRMKVLHGQAISELCGVTEVLRHTIAARHKRAHPALTPAAFTYPGGMEG